MSVSPIPFPERIVVTGGASGIGLSIVQHFAAKGCTVISVDKDDRRPRHTTSFR